MISCAAKDFAELDVNRIKTDQLLSASDAVTIGATMARVVIHARTRAPHDHNFIVVHVDAPEPLVNGGRAVEAGYGPNYYRTYGELKDAIRYAIRQLDTGTECPDDVIDDPSIPM